MSEDASVIFNEGDRVDHGKFGLGTVVDVEGDKIQVEFDNMPGSSKRLLSSFLTMISSPEAKPFVFYDKQWRAMHATWLEARRSLEALVVQFRPPPDPQKLAQLKSLEEAAWARLEGFIQADQAGHHV